MDLLSVFNRAAIQAVRKIAALSLLALMGLTFTGCPSCEDDNSCDGLPPFVVYFAQDWTATDVKVIKCDSIDVSRFYSGFDIKFTQDKDSSSYYVFRFTIAHGSPAFPPSGTIYLEKKDIESANDTVGGKRNDGIDFAVIDVTDNLAAGDHRLNFVLFGNAECTPDAGRSKSGNGNYIFRVKE
jgi:hypothetical protein